MKDIKIIPETSKYAKYFTLEKRVNSTKKIAMLRSELLDDFFKEFIADAQIDRGIKAVIITSISGGLRVTEALSLNKTDFYKEDGFLYAESEVLKKKDKNEERLIMIHPAAQAFMEDYLDNKVGKLFDYTRDGMLKAVKRIFDIPGICNHSWRHTMISYFLFAVNFSREKTAKLMHVSIGIIDRYAHLNEKKTLKEAFGKVVTS